MFSQIAAEFPNTLRNTRETTNLTPMKFNIKHSTDVDMTSGGEETSHTTNRIKPR